MPRNFISAPHFLVFCKFSGPWLLSWPFPSPYIKEALSLLEATFFFALKAAYVALGPWPEKWRSCVHYRAPKVVGPLQDRILKSVFAYLYHWGVFGKHKCSEVSIWCALRKRFVLCIFLVGSDTKIREFWTDSVLCQLMLLGMLIEFVPLCSLQSDAKPIEISWRHCKLLSAFKMYRAVTRFTIAPNRGLIPLEIQRWL